MDVAREKGVRHVFEKIHERFGRIDILVNNAGTASTTNPRHEITEEEWDHVQTVNVKGVFFCTKHAIPFLRRAGGGSIINLSSIYGLIGAGCSAEPIYDYDGLPPDQVIANMQGALQRLGYYRYAVDGVLGPLKRAAIANYQRDHDLAATGAIDPHTLTSLGFIA